MTRHAELAAAEAEASRHRAALGETLGTLHDRLGTDHLAAQALGLLRDNASLAGRTVAGTARAHPVALALAGAGVVWLLIGRRGAQRGPDPRIERVEALSRWEDEGGPVAPLPHAEDDDDWNRRTDRLRQRATAALHRIEAEAARGVGALRTGVGAARDLAAERSAVVAELAAGLGESFRHGLTGLSEAAQARVVAARETAYAARLQAEEAAHDGKARALRVVDDHPLVAGAVAVAIGAALAAALPASRAENRLLGPERDRLMRDAARLLREERARASRTARDIGDDLAKVTRDALGSVAAQADVAARRVAGRLRDAVDEAAEDVSRARSRSAEEIEREVQARLKAN